MLQHGVRSEGKHGRFTPNGSRVLEYGERFSDKVIRVKNPVENRILVDASFDPLFPPDRFDKIQQQMATRAVTQRGIPRSTDPGKYPLSTRVVDLTDGCGSVMYGVPHSKMKAGNEIKSHFYKCARHMKNQSCNHNKVDGERLLEVALRALKHMLRQTGSRSALRDKLLEIATNRPSEIPQEDQTRSRLESSIAKLTLDREEIGKKLSIETDPKLGQLFRSEYGSKGKKLAVMQGQRAGIESKKGNIFFSVEDQVQQAFKLLDKLESLAALPEARPCLNEIMKSLGIWVGVDFHKVKWGNRPVRCVRHGIITMGDIIFLYRYMVAPRKIQQPLMDVPSTNCRLPSFPNQIRARETAKTLEIRPKSTRRKTR